MNKEYINIDQEVREKLTNYEGLPPGVDRGPAPNWSRIEALLDEEEEKRSPFIWAWVGAAAVLLLLGVFGVLRMTNSTGASEGGEILTVVEEGPGDNELVYQRDQQNTTEHPPTPAPKLDNGQPENVQTDGTAGAEVPPPPVLSDDLITCGPVVANGTYNVTLSESNGEYNWNANGTGLLVPAGSTDNSGYLTNGAGGTVYGVEEGKVGKAIKWANTDPGNSQVFTTTTTEGNFKAYSTTEPTMYFSSPPNFQGETEIEMPSVVITGSAVQHQGIADSPVMMTTISSNEISAQGSRDITTALTTMPGVQTTGRGRGKRKLRKKSFGFLGKSGGKKGTDPGLVGVPANNGRKNPNSTLVTSSDKNLEQNKKIDQILKNAGTFTDSLVLVTEPQSFENYSPIIENPFISPFDEALSTFSIDVDHASYSNVRRFIMDGYQPQPDAVRVEEMVNYFNYDYKAPPADGTVPFNLISEISDCPWTDNHKLVHIGLQGRKIDTENLPPSNLVFLVDVSGSMSSTNKLPLLKESFALLVEQLRPQDRVSLVVYAGAAGVVLQPTPGDKKDKILKALDNLSAGGSTAGGQGIELAYKLARENFMKEGNNRVVLATDGDFNVGVSSQDGLEKLIEERRKDGVFLSVLGFGTGNYQDSKMQTLADKGNGNHYYIDNLMEAKKTLVNEFGGTMYAIAKDVKIQVEFNPALVKSYRLIGYENRMLAKEDFDNDAIDAGELGAGHTVTALYEIEPANGDFSKDEAGLLTDEAKNSHQWLTLKLRYKEPDGEKSKLIRTSLKEGHKPLQKTSDNYRWSAAVAGFGLLLRNSRHKGKADYNMILKLANGAKGPDPEGYRAEFIQMVKKMKGLESMQAGKNGGGNGN